MKFWEAIRELEQGRKIRRRFFTHCIPCNSLFELAKFLKDSEVEEINSHLNAEWEIYIDTSKNHSFLDVITGMVEGKRYRRPSWRKDRNPIWTWHMKGSMSGKLKGEDLIADDWIEVSDE